MATKQRPTRKDPKRSRGGGHLTEKPTPQTNFPDGPDWIPHNPPDTIPSGGDAFNISIWNNNLPALMLPVRIETKYVDGKPDDELRIRMLPDAATVRGAAPASPAEIDEAKDFWLVYHEAGGDQRQAAWRHFAQRVGSHRAGYLARLVRPTFDAQGDVMFPAIAAGTDTPGFASLLPERWMATGWVDDAVAFKVMSRPVVRPLRTSPDPKAATRTIGQSGLTIDAATAWLFDYDEAVSVGMAITVPLTGTASKASSGVSTLVVVGLDESQKPTSAANELTEVFEEHSRSTGLAFVPQGTPTNNTETVESGYRRLERELADLEARELETVASDPDDNASRLTAALGLSDLEMFTRLAHGTDREHARSRDMRTALFETVIGGYVRQLLAVNEKGTDVLTAGIDANTITSVRTWFEDWVTGGAPVPTLRIGQQPYGVLPVMNRVGTTHEADTKTNIAATVEVLIEEWRSALPLVPVLDHNATDGLTSEVEARDTVTAVLANNPHPRRLVVRSGSDWSDNPPPGTGPTTPAAIETSPADLATLAEFDRVLVESTGGFRYQYDQAIEALNNRYLTSLKPLYDAVRQAVIPPGRVIITAPPAGRSASREELDPIATDAHIRGIEEQLAIWAQMALEMDTQHAIDLEYGEYMQEFRDYIADVIEQLERHELRQRPLRWMHGSIVDGVLGRDDAQILLTRFSTIGRTWQRSTVTDDEPPGDVTTAEYMQALANRLENNPFDPGGIGTGGTGDPDIDVPDIDLPWILLLDPAFLEAAPLLYQMISMTALLGDNRAGRSEAVERLSQVDPVELDWLMRETLGLGSNRLDAWNTSLATERLATMRTTDPTGLYIGAYGFVLDLERSGNRESNGFIHAPSLAHASSAAVVRSGWLARGSEDNESPAALDLTSGRIREADWLLSGVRNGQDLGELLGARFERGLHDARLDVVIRPLRLQVAEADGLGESAADQPVDGSRLLDLHRDGTLSISDLGLSTPKEKKLIGLLEALEAGFDAVDDVTTFEAVHQLVVGNLERSAAVADAMGPNGGRPPELLAVQTPRGALTIDTRAVVVIDATSVDLAGWASGTRDSLDPALNAWASSMLPDPATVGWKATESGGIEVDFSLADVSISALDACYLADDDPATMTRSMRRLLELAKPSAAFTSFDPTNTSADISLAEFQLLALELKRVIQEATIATPVSMGAPETVLAEDVADPIALQAAIDALRLIRESFDAVLASGAWDELLTEQQAALARVGLVPTVGADVAEDFELLKGRIERRIHGHDAVEDPDSLAGVRARAANLIGAASPVLMPFEMPGAEGVQLSADLADPDDVDDWFDTAAMVRPRVAGLWRSVELGGLLGVAAPDLQAGQYPLLPNDEWASLVRPAPGTGGRVSVAAALHGSVETGSSVVGFVIDQWAERIPVEDQITGVSFHFDGPSNEAPQTALLVVPPEGESWSADLVVDSLLDTIEWAQLRGVAIDDLGDFGHCLPTTVVPGTLDHQIVEGAAS